MRHRVLCCLSYPPTVVISQRTIGSLPSFTQALQVAASRAWMRRISSHPNPSSNIRNCLVSSSPCHSRSYGSSGSSSGFSPDSFIKRRFATRPRDSMLCSMTTAKKSDRTQGISVCRANFCSKDFPPKTRGTAPSLWTSPKAPHEVFPPTHDVDMVDTHSVDPSETPQLEMTIDEYHNLQVQDADTRQASTFKHPSPRQKPISSHVQAPISTSLRKPISKQTLFNNLRLSQKLYPLPTVPAVIDYHDSYPNYRSTKSYNFVLELAIRHAQFGTARWLLNAMHHDGIPWNAITHRLSVRLLVRTGEWELAWRRVTGLFPNDVLRKPPSNKIQVPCKLWVELLGAVKRGAIRQPRWGINEVGDLIRRFKVQVAADPAPGTVAYSRRKQLLACLQPVFESKSETIRPRLIKAVVSLLLQDGSKSKALKLMESYLLQLPKQLLAEIAVQCLDIIHVLLAADTKGGLKSFYPNRRLLYSLLKLHPSLKPSSTTLRLILSPLKKVRKCGTIAITEIRRFERNWGKKIVDRSIRRRVAQLAEKEGRVDILDEMTRLENWENRKEYRPGTVARPLIGRCHYLRSGLCRPPDRKLFPHKGIHNTLLTRLRARIHYREARTSSASAVATPAKGRGL